MGFPTKISSRAKTTSTKAMTQFTLWARFIAFKDSGESNRRTKILGMLGFHMGLDALVESTNEHANFLFVCQISGVTQEALKMGPVFLYRGALFELTKLLKCILVYRRSKTLVEFVLQLGPIQIFLA